MNDAGAGAGESPAAFVVGIDLGTTNSAVAWAEPARSPRIGTFPIPQLVAEGEVGAWDSLPSAVYLAGDLSRFVTGTTVHVDGGNTAAAGWIRAGEGAWRTA